MMRALNAGEYTGEIIQKFSVDSVVITNTVYGLNKSVPHWHCHENLHFCFVFQGGRAETKRSINYTGQGGSIFFYHSEEMHRWVSPLPISKSANIEIGREFLELYDLTEVQIKDAILRNIDAKALILRIVKEMRQEDAYTQLSINALLLELFSQGSDIDALDRPQWIISLKELLHDAPEISSSLSELAAAIGVHPVTISKNFRRYFHCTFGEYRRRIKISKSIDLIKNSDKSLSEIAFECGFSDQSHFIRNFKLRTGFLPKGFRSI